MSNLIRYNLMSAAIKCNEKRHAIEVMNDLGITYQQAVPQSMFDSWWFFNCKNLPEKLPEFLSLKEDINPLDYVGNGIDRKLAEDLERG